MVWRYQWSGDIGGLEISVVWRYRWSGDISGDIKSDSSGDITRHSTSAQFVQGVKPGVGIHLPPL